MTLNVKNIRKLFPFFKYNQDIVYFDSAASSQKPLCVINAMEEAYLKYYGNVHRGMCTTSMKITNKYEKARQKIATFINAKDKANIVFTSGTTSAINIVAHGFEQLLKPGDEIIISAMEHHSNLVPWLQLAQRIGIKINIIPLLEDSSLDMQKFHDFLARKKTKLVSITHASNVLGTINPIKKIVKLAKSYGSMVLIDGAQGIVHEKVDVLDIGCDFYTFSGHKLYGPTGIGVLYGKKEALDNLSPLFGGGEMVSSVSYDKFALADVPYRFEAGTPAITQAIGLGAAIDFISSQDMLDVKHHGDHLINYLMNELKSIQGLKIVGPKENRIPLLSFFYENISSLDISTLLANFNICLRSGFHCVEPLVKSICPIGLVRVSLGIYNEKRECDIFLEKLEKTIKILS